MALKLANIRWLALTMSMLQSAAARHAFNNGSWPHLAGADRANGALARRRTRSGKQR